MAKRPHGGDIAIHFARKKCMVFAVLGSQWSFFDAQYGGPYRNWPNGRRVATSTSRLTAHLRIVLHGRIRVISNRGKGESPRAPPAKARGRQRRPEEAREAEEAGRPERQTGKRRQQQAGRSKQAAAGEQQVASREPAGLG